MVRVGKYDVGPALGEGTFGSVFEAYDPVLREAVAIKALDKRRVRQQAMDAQIMTEIAAMRQAKQALVVSLLEVLASPTHIYIVLELVPGGTLFRRVVESKDGRLDEATARRYFGQLVTGVAYCHECGVCHRDLKPENVLLDAQDRIKISDFGLAALCGADAALHTSGGTPHYAAPEVLMDGGYNGHAADVWSCGVLLYVLLAGYVPFQAQSTAALLAQARASAISYPSWTSAAAANLISCILEPRPLKRLTLSKVAQHLWMAATQSDGPMVASRLGEERGEVCSSSSKAAGPAIAPKLIKLMGTAGGVDGDGPGDGDTGVAANAFELLAMGGWMDVTSLLCGADVRAMPLR